MAEGRNRAHVPVTWATPPYRTARVLCWTELKLLHRIRVLGKQHLPTTGGFLIASNHQSFLDIPIVAGAFPRRHVCFVARDTLAESRSMAWFMRRAGVILIRRGASDRRALTAMVEQLRLGCIVCVFPEGTRSRDGSLGPFLPGAVFASKRARVPIVPAAISGAHRVLPRGALFPRPHRITLEFGPPIDGSRRDAMDLSRDSIAGMIQGA